MTAGGEGVGGEAQASVSPHNHHYLYLFLLLIIIIPHMGEFRGEGAPTRGLGQLGNASHD